MDSNLTADGTRNSHEWQIRVALNEFRIYYDGYPDVIASSWQDDVQSLVDRGYNPDTIFLEYAYLRHNTDSSVGRQVETVYFRDFTIDNVEYANALGSANQLMVSIVGADQEIAISDVNIYRDADGNVLVDIEYNGGADVLRQNGQSPDQITLNPRTGQITATYSDGTTNDFTRVGDEIFENCFSGEVPIDMWPLDPDLKPGPDGIYDQDAVRAKAWKKPIGLIRVGDLVVSFDDDGNLVPGPVTRTFQNNAKILLNFHGTRVTPGHVYYRPDSKKSYKYETLIDVLCDDGMIKHQDGTLIRAATNAPVDSPRDGFVRAIAAKRKAGGTFEQTDEGRIRLGTRFLVGTGKERKSFAVADLIEHGGGVVGDDEMIRVGGGEPMPFLWDFGETLPKPEDFVLACSGTTLEDIYKAAEWESQGPRLPAPMVLDRGPVQPLKGAALSAMPRNEPLNVAHAPMTPAKPQRTLNRQQRKAMEARQRKAAKSG